MVKVAVIGTTSWGITLALMLAQKKLEVRLWARTEKEAAKLRNSGPDRSQFPGVTFPPQIVITSHVDEALDDVKAVLLVVPSQTMRQNIQMVASHLLQKRFTRCSMKVPTPVK